MTIGNSSNINERKGKKRSQFKAIWFRFKKNKLAMVGLVILAFLIAVAIAAPVISDYEVAIKQNIRNRLQPPNKENIFGTDQYGRDIFARIVFGARVSLFAGIVGISTSSIIGAVIGSVAGYYGGRVDNILMRLMDILMALPSMLLAISIVAALGAGLTNLIIALSVSYIAQFSRIIRSSVLSIKNQEFIEAAVACGTRDRRIIFKHIIPNAIGPLLVQSTLSIASAIILISSLSFLGLGIKPPMPEWGSMLADARSQMRNYPYLVIIPGLAIILSVMGLNLIGDGLRDALDPRLKD
ncbi:MAG: ABC transporter permease [Syntrophomonadaceae bacterium]|jgi:peptide/nickel transport system permease protein|nr:ABC transporter permease [Syntrophomonadaceae bacterium]